MNYEKINRTQRKSREGAEGTGIDELVAACFRTVRCMRLFGVSRLRGEDDLTLPGTQEVPFSNTFRGYCLSSTRIAIWSSRHSSE